MQTSRLNETVHFVTQGRYADHIQRWLDLFPREQIHFVDSAHLVAKPWEVMAELEQFLGLEHNVTREDFIFVEEKGFFCPRNRETGEAECLGSMKGLVHPEIPDFLKEQLIDYYEPVNKKFYEMAGKDFNWTRRDK